MNGSALYLDPARERSSSTRDGILLNELSELSGNSEVRRPPMNLTINPQNEACVGAAEAGCVLNQRFEHRLQVESGAADHLQHFTCSGLLVEGFGEIAIAFLQFRKQPNVLDRDDGLIRKCLEKGDLLFREWPDLFAANQDNPNGNAFS